jgi:hypothetical protein
VKLRETTVEREAPQTPFSFPSLPVKRQGPIKQREQQLPERPIEQGERLSARSKQVEIPAFFIFSERLVWEGLIFPLKFFMKISPKYGGYPL